MSNSEALHAYLSLALLEIGVPLIVVANAPM